MLLREKEEGGGRRRNRWCMSMTWEFCISDIGNGRVWYFKLNNPQKRQPPSQRARPNFPAEITVDNIGESVATHDTCTINNQ